MEDIDLNLELKAPGITGYKVIDPFEQNVPWGEYFEFRI
jgi:hypothetical protein